MFGKSNLWVDGGKRECDLSVCMSVVLIYVLLSPTTQTMRVFACISVEKKNYLRESRNRKIQSECMFQYVPQVC